MDIVIDEMKTNGRRSSYEILECHKLLILVFLLTIVMVAPPKKIKIKMTCLCHGPLTFAKKGPFFFPLSLFAKPVGP